MNLPFARTLMWSPAPDSRRVHTLLAVSLLAPGMALGMAASAHAEGNQVLCWGRNLDGQCAVPTTLGTVSALGGGVYHTIALRADGTVVCWGANPEGQASVPAGLGNAIAVAAGSYHSAAVKSNHTVACWGRSIEGQCAVPASLTNASAVSAGWKHTVALKSDGTVVAWGLAGSSQVTVPAGLAGVAQVSSGSQHNIALKTDGTVVCWGAGTTNTGISPNLGQSIVPAGLSGVSAVAAGANHSVALKLDGSVVAWGQNAFGVSTPPAGLTQVRSIAAGNAHTLALKQDGTIIGWGSNSSGQLTVPATSLVPTGVFAGGQHSGGMFVVAPSATVVATTDSVCHGSTGAIDVTVNEVTATAWTGPNGFTSTSVDLVGVPAGAYTLAATGPGGTTIVHAAVLTAPDVAAPSVTSYATSLTAAGGQDCTAIMPDFRASVVAIDDCSASGALVVTQSPAAGSTAQLGDNAVLLTVRDESGNEATVTATLSVSGHPSTCFLDADGDDYGNGNIAAIFCVAPAGYVPNGTDCNDASASIHPGAPEVCDQVDQNCNQLADEGLPTNDYYLDLDADGFGDSEILHANCALVPPAGHVANALDCNDGSAGIHPGADELCADLAIDNDCDGSTAETEASDRIRFYADIDEDGAGDPSASLLSCAMPDGFVAEPNDQCPANGALIAPLTYYRDFDQDTFGNAASPLAACELRAPAGHVDNATDCNDAALLFADADGDGHGAGDPIACGVPTSDDECPDTQARLAAVAWYQDADADGAGDPTVSVTACDAPAGYLDSSNDLCPANGSLLSPVTYFADADADGFGVPGTTSTVCETSAPAGFAAASTDCNDSVPSTYPGAPELCNEVDDDCDITVDEELTFTTYYRDADADGFGDLASTEQTCTGSPSVGFARNSTDCDDGRAAVNAMATFNLDADHDTYGVAESASLCEVVPPVGYATNAIDCNDAASGVNPGMTEICDAGNVDENCNGTADDLDAGVDPASHADFFADADGDTFTVAAAARFCDIRAGFLAQASISADCNDANPSIRPDALELCNGIDDNCTGGADDGLTFVDYFVDTDSDGFGAGIATNACQPVAGSVTVSGDCDNDNAAIKPDAVETCNGIDDNCVGGADDGLTFVDYFVDTDNDGFGAGIATNACQPVAGSVTVSGDCDNDNAAIKPDAVETCNGIDDNCVGGADDGLTFVDYFVDTDSDGFGAGIATNACQPVAGSVTISGDCDNDNAAIKPGATELCNGIDDNCVGGADDGLTFVDYFVDTDSDGFGAGIATNACQPVAGSVTVSGDCDNDNAAIKPDAVETCNGIDDNCVGGADDGLTFTTYYRDADGDTYGDLATTEANCLGAAGAGFVSNSVDCNDADASANPVGLELCANLAVDNDCNGSVAEAEATDRVSFFADADGDGAGDAAVSQLACAAPSGFVSSSTDQCPANGGLIAQATYFLDSDGDGKGEENATMLSCESTAPAGYAPVAGDGCPSDPAKFAAGACGCGNLDTDSDSDGTADCNDQCPNDAAKTVPGACGCGIADTDIDGDGTANCNDLCPNDPAKIAPGTCGCGVADTDTDGDGVKDCESFVLSLTPQASSAGAGDLLTVRISSDWPLVGAPVRAIAMQLAVRFDHARLRLVSVDNQIAGAPFGLELARIEGIDTDPTSTDPLKGTLEYAAGIDLFGTPPDLGMTAGAPLVDLVFEVLPGTTDCGATDLVRIVHAIGSSPIRTRLTSEELSGSDGLRIPMALAIPGVHLDFDGPAISGVPGTVSVATDAGSAIGAVVTLPPVSAEDGCDGAVATVLSVLLPDGSTVGAWPAEFPYAGTGVSVATWTATDAAGNSSSASMRVEVGPFQRLDATLQLVGAFNGASTRSIRLVTDNWSQVLTVPFTGTAGVLHDVGVPVRAEYPCVAAKDTAHSLTATSPATVVGRKWSASFALSQGDSNDDDSVDIYDFSIFAADRGVASGTNARSNFNADAFVNNADFAFIGSNFFRTGEGCGNLAGGRQPVARVSVKELRRQGLGHLAAADMNHDGWVDMRDIQLFMQGAGIAPGSPDAPIGGGL